jgi:hypothetical protein
MVIKTEDDIRLLIESDEWMMQVLRAAELLNLQDWWIGAGFLRNKVWNALEGKDLREAGDVDLVYFNSDDVTPQADWRFDEVMKRDHPMADWEVRNQARMHHVNKFDPYVSTIDGISNWVETATCVAVKLVDGKLELLFCHGIDDLVNLVARPIPRFQSIELIDTFHDRVKRKEWRKKWPHLKVELN